MGVRYRSVVVAIAILVTASTALAEGREDTVARIAAALREAKAALDGIEPGRGADAAAAEIATCREWIEQGFERLRRGRERQAAILAERVALQVRLVRAVVDLAMAEAETEAAEREALDLERDVRVLEERERRAILEREGRALTGALPAPEENHAD